ncbi:SulP family inorganic anion transporter [Paenibacillus sp. BC26]|uniref:SulP family inorganic anion transporter n=1 Tax=Paenibacillus sp. BC26 TaxID=1881032 RepID=UPI000B8626FA|nr:SulP family inorganic anion transporter [Paenibacillus sp. BC26]
MKWTGRFEGYHSSAFSKDLVSGLIVGVIAIPLGMAFAIASGVKPEYGIYTTIVAGILISLFGGSKFQIGGPTGAFIPILFAIVMQYGYENLLIAGFLAGIILVVMGVLNFGKLIKFIPRPVTIGFTAGIAVIIFSGQIASFLGLKDIEKHENFLPNMREIITHLSTLNIYSLLTAGVGLIVMIAAPKLLPKVPSSLVGLIISSVVAALFFNGSVATIGSTYGAIPSALPHFHFPEITWAQIETLIRPAIIIALLGGIESLLSAVVADGMTGSRHNSNRELIGQGIANMVTPLFGGIPVTGAIARTATNIKSGAMSPMSGVIHGIVVFFVLILLAPYASRIPLASMAPILMLVAWNMSERKKFIQILRTRTADSIVLLITFSLTVFTNLTTAVEVGLVLAIILFVKQMSEMLTVTKVLPDPTINHEKVKAYMVTAEHDCPQISILSIDGSLFFGTASMFEKSVMDAIRLHSKIVLLRMGKMPFMDTTGESHLTALLKHSEKSGGIILISGIQSQPLELLRKTGLIDRIGNDHRFEHTGDAIDYALTQLNTNKCLGCKHFAFRECTALSNADPSDVPTQIEVQMN